jgi:ribosome-associated toxin RatA of RatAB toxin-antitoxin module
MTTISRSALLPYSAQQIYILINDVVNYPHYMDGCVGAEVLSEGKNDDGSEFMLARLDLAKAGLRHSLTTRNTLLVPHRVEMTLVEGPFDDFKGLWLVQSLNDTACKISLEMVFSLNNKVLGKAAKVLFNPMADNLVDAVVKRAHYLHREAVNFMGTIIDE